MNLDDRFWSKVDLDTEGCWRWVACLNAAGYGLFRHEGRSRLAHRLAWAEVNGEAPAGTVLDHLCRNRYCIRPDHLEAVTRAENNRRGWRDRTPKPYCVNGHEYTPENTYIQTTGMRQCLTCKRAQSNAWYYRHLSPRSSAA